MSYGQRPPRPPWGAADPLRDEIKQLTGGVEMARKTVVERRERMSPTHGGRAVKRMVNLMEGFHRQLEQHVDETLKAAIAPKLENAKGAVTRMGQVVGKAFDEAAQHADDYTNQLSNEPADDPTGSAGSHD